MGIRQGKIYYDGSHYIAIDSNAYPKRKGRSRPKPPVTVEKQEFDKAYKESLSLPKRERKEHIDNAMEDMFRTEEQKQEFIAIETEKKKRNRLVRMQRVFRKINLQTWDYFCTFTYDSANHTEESFKKSLLNCLRHLATNKGWRYIGAWEYSPKRERLHFHGIFIIPQMIGELIEVRDWSVRKHRMQTTIQNTHFNNKFGRSDFEVVERREDVISTALYLLKYIEKDGGKIIISRNLPTFFVSDIADEDILCYMAEENRKAILFDNFTCMDEGVLIGTVSKEVIDKMPKCN